MRAATAHAAVGRGLRFDAAALVSREFRCVSTLPLWFRANSGRGHLGCGPQRRTRWGGAFVSTLPLWFCANSVAFRRLLCSPRCGFARIRCVSTLPLLRAATAHAVRGLRFDAPAVVSREFWRLLACSGLFWGGPLGLRAAAVHAVGRGLRFDAPAVVFFEASSSLLRPLLALLTVWGLRRHTFFFFYGPFSNGRTKRIFAGIAWGLRFRV